MSKDAHNIFILAFEYAVLCKSAVTIVLVFIMQKSWRRQTQNLRNVLQNLPHLKVRMYA